MKMKSDFNRGREETMNISFPSSYSTCSANTPSNSDEKCHRKVSNDGEASRTTDLLTNRCGTKRRSSAVISEQSNVTRSKAKRIHEVEAVYSNFSLSLLSAREKRPFVNHSYSDHYHDPPVDDADLGSIVAHSKSRLEQRPSTAVSSIIEPQQTHRPSRGGVTVAFPEKLHEMLQTVFDAGLDHVVSWQPHGRCFLIRQKEMFVEHVMSRFFHQSKLTSFQRQLNLYGFTRLTTGADRGAYYHELFLRGRVDLCRQMIRTRIKGNGMKAAASPSTEPNFYQMEYCLEEGTSPREEQTEASSTSNNSTINEYQREDDEDYIANSLSSSSDCSSVVAIEDYNFAGERQDAKIGPGLTNPRRSKVIRSDFHDKMQMTEDISNCVAMVSPLSSPSRQIDMWHDSISENTPFLFVSVNNIADDNRNSMWCLSRESDPPLSLTMPLVPAVSDFYGYEASLIPDEFPSSLFQASHLTNDTDDSFKDCFPETGDEVFFEGSKFHFLHHDDML